MSLKNTLLWRQQDKVCNSEIYELLHNKDGITLFNIESTTRCNNACTYCHFYNGKYDKSYCKDIDDDLFTEYLRFINYFSKNSDTMVQWRFSWWDPIVLGDRLFRLADYWFKISGIQPYILTAGRGINEEWITKARKSSLQNAFISVENPLDQDPGANKTENVLESIKKYNDPSFPLMLGVCIIKNRYFWQLLEICDYFFDQVGQIPTIHELNYDSFETPSEEELWLLRGQIEKVLKKYWDKLLLRLFPSVFPELCFGGKMVYLSDLPIQDSHDFYNKNNQERLLYMARRFLWFSYPNMFCDSPCELKDFCNNAKRFWQYNWHWEKEEHRKNTYCKLKKILSDIYLDIFE